MTKINHERWALRLSDNQKREASKGASLSSDIAPNVQPSKLREQFKREDQRFNSFMAEVSRTTDRARAQKYLDKADASLKVMTRLVAELKRIK